MRMSNNMGHIVLSIKSSLDSGCNAMYSSPCTCYNEFSSAGSDVLGFSFRRASGLLLMFLWGDRGKQLTFARHARNDPNNPSRVAYSSEQLSTS